MCVGGFCINNNEKNEYENTIHEISTEELFKIIDEPHIQLIDIRPIAAYNGWQLNHETRGGHIKNARSLPFKWSNYIDWIEIVRSKEILPQHTVIVYGYDKDKIKKIAHQFMKTGYQDVRIYLHFIDEWSKKTLYTMQSLDRYQHLVSADWLHELINTNTAPLYDNDKFIICHVHYQNKKDYEKGHIPKAKSLDTNHLESLDSWNCRSPEELKRVFERHGITHDTTVVLYGRFSFPDNSDPYPGSSAGHLGAIRAAFIMLYAGVKDIRLLNGGMQSWIDAGYEISTEEDKKQPVIDFGPMIPAHPEIVVDLNQAKEIIRSPNKNLVSVRSWNEYIGKVSGYHYIKEKGRIPGSVFGNCGSDAYHMENYRNLDHTMKEYHEIEKIWKENGITADKHNAFYCGTGWRASEAFFNAWLMGWPFISVYDGGWFEWTKTNNLYETGIPNKNEKQLIME